MRAERTSMRVAGAAEAGHLGLRGLLVRCQLRAPRLRLPRRLRFHLHCECNI